MTDKLFNNLRYKFWFSKKGLIFIFILLLGLSFASWFCKGSLARMVGGPFLQELGPPEAGSIRFAVIGDYGSGKQQERDVARLIKSWNPDFITTLGDNNHPIGAAETIDRNIGKYFHEYIAVYKGKYGQGALTNRFFPIPGHRDWDTDKLKPYTDYFTLPGNERYYDFVWGPVHFFMLDTDEREPDGATELSLQAYWLKQKLIASTKPWKLVFAHHAPYISRRADGFKRMRWPFGDWGASAVLSGFYHVYERFSINGIPYFVNGVGGASITGFGKIHQNSQFRYNEDYGAMLVEASKTWIKFKFINRKGEVLDEYSIMKRAHSPHAQE